VTKKLSLGELANKLKALEKHYAQRNKNIEFWRALYFKLEKVYFANKDGKVPKQEDDEIRLVMPVAMTTVNSFNELLLTKAPAITVPRSNVQPEIGDVAEHNEKALHATWAAARIHHQVVDANWFGLVDGWGVLQIIWDKDADLATGECPIVIFPRNPKNIYALPGKRPNSWKYVINAYPTLVGTVREDWSGSLDKRNNQLKETQVALDGLKDTDTITYIEYWDDKIHAVAFNILSKRGKQNTIPMYWLKRPQNHNYGFLPWEIYFPCSLPFRTVGARMGVSILHAVESLVIYFTKLVSRRGTHLERHLDPPLKTKTEAGRDFELIRTHAGMQLLLGIDEDAEYLVNPGPTPQLDMQIQLLLGMMERCTLPAVLQGQYVGAISGIAMSLLRNPTLMKIAFKQEALENVLVSLNSKILRLYEGFLRKPWYIWGSDSRGAPMDTVIDPTMIKGYYRNDVKLSASLPTDDANTVNMIATLVQLRLLSRQTGLDVLQQMLHELLPQSVTDETKRILAEAILDNPVIMQGLAMKAAQEGGLPIPLEMPGQPQRPTGPQGPREVTQPAQTLAPQTPGMPGGNVQPNINQRLQELKQGMPGRVEEEIE